MYLRLKALVNSAQGKVKRHPGIRMQMMNLRREIIPESALMLTSPQVRISPPALSSREGASLRFIQLI